MKQFKGWLLNASLVLGSLGVGVILGEIGLRLAGIQGAPKQVGTGHETFAPSFFAASHPDRGWANLPGAKGWWEHEGRSYVEINQGGMRDRPYSVTKSENTFRVAVLGDSFTLASQVPMEQNYTSVMETTLRRCIDLKSRSVEVLNFGVDGYSTAQELMTLRQAVWQYEPDAVVLAFFIGNDVIDNSKKLESNHYRPFFNLENGELILDDSFKELTSEYSDRYWITTVDRLPTGLINRSRILQVIRKAELENKKRNLLNHLNQLNAKNFRPPEDQTWQEAWNVTEVLLNQINTEVKQRGAEFLLVLIGDPMQVRPEPEVRQEFMRNHAIQNFFYPNQRLQKLGQERGFPVLDLAAPFQQRGESTQVCLHGFETAVPCGGHWNPQGHQFAGELITDQLCQIIAAR
ncbi:MAG: SGNH/GDSL hydrolase family protein [Microcoleaceae cyanobacterium]